MPVRPSIQTIKAISTENFAARSAAPIPTVNKVLPQKLRYGRVFDAEHHVVPARIVLTEVYAADVSNLIVNNDQFLMIAIEETSRCWPKWIAVFDCDSQCRKIQREFLRRPHFIPKFSIKPVARGE